MWWGTLKRRTSKKRKCDEMEWNGIEFADVISKLLRIPAISVFVSYDEIYIITMNRVFFVVWFLCLSDNFECN